MISGREGTEKKKGDTNAEDWCTGRVSPKSRSGQTLPEGGTFDHHQDSKSSGRGEGGKVEWKKEKQRKAEVGCNPRNLLKE